MLLMCPGNGGIFGSCFAWGIAAYEYHGGVVCLGGIEVGGNYEV